jgi:hypothetical protein
MQTIVAEAAGVDLDILLIEAAGEEFGKSAAAAAHSDIQ